MPAFLIHTSVKATIVLLVAWLVTRAMARCSAAARHLVWTLAIVAALLLPLLQVAAPRWNLPLLAAPAVTPAPLAVSAAAPESEPAPPQPVDPSLEQDVTLARVTPAATAVVDPLPAVPAATEVSWVAAAMAVWIAGLTMALARLAAGLAWVSRITREAADVDDPGWMALLERARGGVFHHRARLIEDQRRRHDPGDVRHPGADDPAATRGGRVAGGAPACRAPPRARARRAARLPGADDRTARSRAALVQPARAPGGGAPARGAGARGRRSGARGGDRCARVCRSSLRDRPDVSPRALSAVGDGGHGAPVEPRRTRDGHPRRSAQPPAAGARGPRR